MSVQDNDFQTSTIFRQSTLTKALKAAEKAHAEYEKLLGHRDDDWAEWYAAWMISHNDQFR